MCSPLHSVCISFKLPEGEARHKHLQANGAGRIERAAILRFRILVTLLVGALFGEQALAQTPLQRGSVTNLPIPRYVSMKAGEGNLRRGPSLGHRIDWVLKRRNMPLQVIGEHGHWRRVRDQDGAAGWMHYALLSGVRMVIVQEDMAPLRAKPEPEAAIKARAELGVVAKLGDCTLDWCQIASGGQKGWTEKTVLWGVDPEEIRE